MSINKLDNINNELILKDGSKVVFRKATADDAKEMIEYLNTVGGESDNLLFGSGDFKLSVEEEIGYIDSINKDENTLMLLGVIDNKIASISQISSSNKARICHNSEVAISVKKEYWGRGVGSKVMENLIKFAKDTRLIKNITLGVKEDNEVAIKLYKKYGFKKVGFHKDFFNIKGKYFDEILMELYI